MGFHGTDIRFGPQWIMWGQTLLSGTTLNIGDTFIYNGVEYENKWIDVSGGLGFQVQYDFTGAGSLTADLYLSICNPAIESQDPNLHNYKISGYIGLSAVGTGTLVLPPPNLNWPVTQIAFELTATGADLTNLWFGVCYNVT